MSFHHPDTGGDNGQEHANALRRLSELLFETISDGEQREVQKTERGSLLSRFSFLRHLLPSPLRDLPLAPFVPFLAAAPGVSVNVNTNPGTLQTVRDALGLSSNADRNILREARGGVFFFDPGSAERIRRQIPETHRLEGNLFVHVARNGTTSILLPHGTPIPGDGIEQMLLDSEMRRKLKEAGVVLGGSELLLTPDRERATRFLRAAETNYTISDDPDVQTLTQRDVPHRQVEVMTGEFAAEALDIRESVRRTTLARQQNQREWEQEAEKIAGSMQAFLRAIRDRNGGKDSHAEAALRGAFIHMGFLLFGEHMTPEKHARILEVHGLYRGRPHSRGMHLEKFRKLREKIQSNGLCSFLLRAEIAGQPKNGDEEIVQFSGLTQEKSTEVIAAHMDWRFTAGQIPMNGYRFLLTGLIRAQRGEQGLPYDADGNRVLQYLRARGIRYGSQVTARVAKQMFDHLRTLISSDAWLRARQPELGALPSGRVPALIWDQRREVTDEAALEIEQGLRVTYAAMNRPTILPSGAPSFSCTAFLQALRRGVRGPLPAEFDALQANPVVTQETFGRFMQLKNWVTRAVFLPRNTCIIERGADVIVGRVTNWDKCKFVETPWGTALVVPIVSDPPSRRLAVALGRVGFVDEASFRGTGMVTLTDCLNVPPDQRGLCTQALLNASSAEPFRQELDTAILAYGRAEEFEHAKSSLVADATEAITGESSQLQLFRPEGLNAFRSAMGIPDQAWEGMIANPLFQIFFTRCVEEARASLGAEIAAMNEFLAKDPPRPDLANAAFHADQVDVERDGDAARFVLNRLVRQSPHEVQDAMHELFMDGALREDMEHTIVSVLVRQAFEAEVALQGRARSSIAHPDFARRNVEALERVAERFFHSPETMLREIQRHDKALAALSEDAMKRMGGEEMVAVFHTLTQVSSRMREENDAAKKERIRRDLGVFVEGFIKVYVPHCRDEAPVYESVLRLQLAELLVGDMENVNLRSPELRRAILRAHHLPEFQRSLVIRRILRNPDAIRAMGDAFIFGDPSEQSPAEMLREVSGKDDSAINAEIASRLPGLPVAGCRKILFALIQGTIAGKNGGQIIQMLGLKGFPNATAAENARDELQKILNGWLNFVTPNPDRMPPELRNANRDLPRENVEAIVSRLKLLFPTLRELGREVSCKDFLDELKRLAPNMVLPAAFERFRGTVRSEPGGFSALVEWVNSDILLPNGRFCYPDTKGKGYYAGRVMDWAKHDEYKPAVDLRSIDRGFPPVHILHAVIDPDSMQVAGFNIGRFGIVADRAAHAAAERKYKFLRDLKRDSDEFKALNPFEQQIALQIQAGIVKLSDMKSLQEMIIAAEEGEHAIRRCMEPTEHSLTEFEGMPIMREDGRRGYLQELTNVRFPGLPAEVAEHVILNAQEEGRASIRRGIAVMDSFIARRDYRMAMLTCWWCLSSFHRGEQFMTDLRWSVQNPDHPQSMLRTTPLSEIVGYMFHYLGSELILSTFEAKLGRRLPERPREADQVWQVNAQSAERFRDVLNDTHDALFHSPSELLRHLVQRRGGTR